MIVRDLGTSFERKYEEAIALVPSSRREIDILRDAVQLAVMRSYQAANEPVYQELMLDLLGLYTAAVQRTWKQGPAAKYHDTQIAHALFKPLRDMEDGNREMRKENVEGFVKNMNEGGLERFLLVAVPHLTNRLEAKRLRHH